MSNPEVFLTGLLSFLWVWRIASFLYSSYLVSEAVMPSCAGTGAKVGVMCAIMCATLALSFIPMAEYPRLSLASRVASIPSQMNTVAFVYRYVASVLGSRRVKALVVIFSVLSFIETIYMINYDWNRIQ